MEAIAHYVLLPIYIGVILVGLILCYFLAKRLKKFSNPKISKALPIIVMTCIQMVVFCATSIVVYVYLKYGIWGLFLMILIPAFFNSIFIRIGWRE